MTGQDLGVGGDRGLLAERQYHPHQRAWPKQAVCVRHGRADGDRARPRIDGVLDHRDMTAGAPRLARDDGLDGGGFSRERLAKRRQLPITTFRWRKWWKTLNAKSFLLKNLLSLSPTGGGIICITYSR